MAIEKTYTDLIDQAKYRDDLGLTIPIHSPRKYKKCLDNELNKKFCGQEIGTGTRLIVQCLSRNSGYAVEGYMLCAVVDMEDASDYWSNRTTFIVEVLEASNPALIKHVGRLRTVKTYSHYYESRILLEVGKKNWHKYLTS